MLCSVILTTYNRCERVECALRSIMAQTHRPLEIVVVDNGSTDGSRERCAAMIEAEQQESGLSFQLLVQPRKGVCAARNLGLQAAKGEWVAFFDDDDEMSPDFMEKMGEAAQSCPSANWVLTQTKMVFPDGHEQIRAGWPTPRVADHLLGSLVSTQSFLGRRGWLLSLGGWDETLPVWNDYALGVKMLCADPHPLWVRGAFHRIVQHANSITGTEIQQKTEGMILAFCAIRRLLDTDLADTSVRVAACSALYHRLEIVAGQLSASGYSSSAVVLLSATKPLFSVSRGQRLFGRLLRWYAALGGRGAWRVARLTRYFGGGLCIEFTKSEKKEADICYSP